MQHTENLNLNLPDDNDPLEVSKLSENFEILDEAIGDQSSAAALAKSMKIGDITYSTRNLEEESGGVLMACDQRTIDTDAYPDLPRNVLFWPLPELVFTWDDANAKNIIDGSNYSAYTGINRDASTDKFIYTNFGVSAGSNGAVQANVVYSVDEQKIYYVETPAATVPFVRIAPNKIVLLNGAAQIYNNVLTPTGETQSAGAAALRSVSEGSITRLGPSSFFIVSWQASSAVYPLGFYRTDDGFATIQPITSANELKDISATTFDQLDAGLRTGALHKSPFFPAQKKADGEVVVCFKGSASGATYTASSEIGTRQNIRNMLPTVWETSGGLSTISSRKLGGQALEDWVWSKMVDHNSSATTKLYAPINGEYYFLVVEFSWHISTSICYAAYAVMVNIESGELFTSTVSHKFPNTKTEATKFFVYDKHKKRLTILKDTSVSRAISIVDIPTKTIAEDATMFGGLDIAPSIPVNYMDSAIAIQITGGGTVAAPVDKRSFERGYPVRVAKALLLLNKDIAEISGFAVMNTMGCFSITSASNSVPPYFYVAIDSGGNGSAASNLVEVDGDIYIPRAASLYKLPKNKRQMPYIKNGYMKVLNEPAEGGTE